MAKKVKRGPDGAGTQWAHNHTRLIAWDTHAAAQMRCSRSNIKNTSLERPLHLGSRGVLAAPLQQSRLHRARRQAPGACPVTAPRAVFPEEGVVGEGGEPTQEGPGRRRRRSLQGQQKTGF